MRTRCRILVPLRRKPTPQTNNNPPFQRLPRFRSIPSPWDPNIQQEAAVRSNLCDLGRSCHRISILWEDLNGCVRWSTESLQYCEDDCHTIWDELEIRLADLRVILIRKILLEAYPAANRQLDNKNNKRMHRSEPQHHKLEEIADRQVGSQVAGGVDHRFDQDIGDIGGEAFQTE